MQNIGLVLSGGGGKGPYEVGVWKALAELGFAKDIMAVSGTSVGALNAALFAQGDLAKAEAAWASMTPSDILSVDGKKILSYLVKYGYKPTASILAFIGSLGMNGIFSRNGLLRIIQDYLDEDLIKSRSIPCFVCATKLPQFKATYFSIQEHKQEVIEDILLASSAIPFVFPVQKVQGEQYLDGFIKDNTPIKPLADLGCNIIIAVMLSRSDILPIDDYPNCKIIPIYPQEDLGAALNFNHVSAKLELGYADTMRTLGPVLELMTVNANYSGELLKYKQQHAEYERILNKKSSLNLTLESASDALQREINKW